MKKFIITSVIPGAPIHKVFSKAINNYAKENDADVLVFDTKANYKELERDDHNVDIPLNDNITISSIKLNINLVDPLTGMESLAARHGSLIFPYPRQRFRTVPRSLKTNPTPLGMWCTGTISEPLYKDTKSGFRMREQHLKGALIVTIEDDKFFHIRQIQANDDGSFYDLNKLYKPSGKTEVIDNIEAINLGDLHPPFLNSEVKDITFNLFKKLKPKKVIYHDAFDSSSVSHHLNGKHITKALGKFKTLEHELEQSSDVLQEFQDRLPYADHVLVKSNHDEHLDRYLDEFRFKEDYNNLELALELAHQKVKYKRKREDQDSLEYGLKKFNTLDNFTWLKRSDSYIVKGIQCGSHGDYGSNGGPGSARAHGLIYDGKSITGHSHSPEIGVFGNIVNGTMTNLTLPYTNPSGGTSWLNTHTIIYPSGTFTQIHIILGSATYVGF